MSKVLISNIQKSYGKNHILKGINLEIQDKEFLVLVGPSGCGKSTLLRIIAGLEEVDSGQVFIGDKNVTYLHPKDRDIAMVFQNYALYPHMTVFENMAFSLKIKKESKEEIQKKVEDAAKILDLSHLLSRKPSELSGGQRQRVALGRAIVRNPKIFLMDEPLSNLDAKLRSSTRFEIKKLHKKLDTTFIYVTHDQVEAMTMGDRIAVLNEGVLQQIGNADEIYQNPLNTFVASFIGSPSINFIEGEIKNGRFNSKICSFDTQYSDQMAIVGIRPEDLYFGGADIQAKVELIEMLGAEKLVHLESFGVKIIARFSADIEVRTAEKISLGINKNKVLFFNKENKNNLKISL